jgi:hypothetical protein
MIAAVTPACRRSGRAEPGCAGLRHVAYSPRYPNFTLHAMYAHRLWIKLWMSLGHPAENRSQLGGNAPVTGQRPVPAHRPAARWTPAGHSACARPRRLSPARTPVIPGIHRPYDDYQSSYGSQIKIQVATGAPRLTGPFSDQPTSRIVRASQILPNHASAGEIMSSDGRIPTRRGSQSDEDSNQKKEGDR